MPSEFLNSLFNAHPDKILAAFIADRESWYDDEGDFIERDMLVEDVLRHQFSSWSMEGRPPCPLDGLIDLRELVGCHQGETLREAIERLLAARK